MEGFIRNSKNSPRPSQSKFSHGKNGWSWNERRRRTVPLSIRTPLHNPFCSLTTFEIISFEKFFSLAKWWEFRWRNNFVARKKWQKPTHERVLLRCDCWRDLRGTHRNGAAEIFVGSRFIQYLEAQRFKFSRRDLGARRKKKPWKKVKHNDRMSMKNQWTHNPLSYRSAAHSSAPPSAVPQNEYSTSTTLRLLEGVRTWLFSFPFIFKHEKFVIRGTISRRFTVSAVRNDIQHASTVHWTVFVRKQPQHVIHVKIFPDWGEVSVAVERTRIPPVCVPEELDSSGGVWRDEFSGRNSRPCDATGRTLDGCPSSASLRPCPSPHPASPPARNVTKKMIK